MTICYLVTLERQYELLFNVHPNKFEKNARWFVLPSIHSTTCSDLYSEALVKGRAKLRSANLPYRIRLLWVGFLCVCSATYWRKMPGLSRASLIPCLLRLVAWSIYRLNCTKSPKKDWWFHTDWLAMAMAHHERKHNLVAWKRKDNYEYRHSLVLLVFLKDILKLVFHFSSCGLFQPKIVSNDHFDWDTEERVLCLIQTASHCEGLLVRKVGESTKALKTTNVLWPSFR